MAGPGIRYHYMAEELSKSFDVTVGFFDKTYLPGNDFAVSYKTKHIDAYAFQLDFQGTDFIIALWLSDAMMDFCNRQNISMVFDIYAPVPVENLASSLYSGKSVSQEANFEHKQSLAMYRKFFENGDLFLFSNRRQLDYWTGFVFGADQVRLSTYNKRPFFDRFIYAPMGIDTTAKLSHTKQVMRDILPGVTKDSKILLWTGGIWGWYDGQILIRVMKRLEKSRPDIKLVFFGTKHPNPNVPEMKESFDTRKLADELGLVNKTVFFQDGWVDYPERVNYLLEADAAINTHKSSIETEFSHRTRVLDHIMAKLPTIGTQGDYLSDEVISRYELGLVVPAENEEALLQAITKVLRREDHEMIKQNIANVRDSFGWDITLSPLKTALSDNLTKLERVAIRHNRMLPTIRIVTVAKKITPVFVKKIIIRALRYGD